MTRDVAVSVILDDDSEGLLHAGLYNHMSYSISIGDVPTDTPTPSEVTPSPTADTPSATTPQPTETPPPPAALEVYFAEDTPHIEGTTVSFVPNTNLPARLSCHLGQEDYDCQSPCDTTVVVIPV